MTSDAYVMITGNPGWNATAGTQVNVRTGAGTNYAVAFTAAIGTTNLVPLAVEPDATNQNSNGKIYQWMQVRFHDNRTGWVRDDLLSIQGDFTQWGYPSVAAPTYLFSLSRGAISTVPSQQSSISTPDSQATPAVTTTPVQAAPATPAPPAETTPVTFVPATANITPVATTAAAQPAPVTAAGTPAIITVAGTPGMAAGGQVNVRSGPGTNHAVAFRTTVGTGNLSILDVQPDAMQRTAGRKLYQWAQLRFPDGQTGWIRDDLIKVRLDARPWGYGNYASDVRLSNVVREGYEIELPPIDVYDPERIRQLAFAITSTFEGKGYDAYNNYDAGIVSYGFIQFTLASGSLFTVVNAYLQRSQSDMAAQLRPFYTAIANRDPNLRYDGNFKRVLIQAAQDPIMQQVQREVATSGFWKRVVDGLLTPRNLRLPLTWALMFDISVNFGINIGFLRRVEKDNGVPALSRVPDNGLTEEDMITQVVELRRQSHYRQAERDNLPGLKVRADFWTHLVELGDQEMRGLPTGEFIIKGKSIDAANPQF